MILKLDLVLCYYYDKIERELNMNVKDILGVGVVGGMGIVLIVFLNVKLCFGIDVVFEEI